VWLRQGRPAPIPSVEDAERLIRGLSPAERAVVDDTTSRAIGGPQTVHAGLLDLLERTGTDELMITSQLADPGARARGLEHIAAAFELAPQPVA